MYSLHTGPSLHTDTVQKQRTGFINLAYRSRKKWQKVVVANP